jgi:hypothetical protein
MQRRSVKEISNNEVSNNEVSNNNLNACANAYDAPMDALQAIEAKYQLSGRLDEATLRPWVSTEARSLGRGGVSLVAKAAGVSRTTI